MGQNPKIWQIWRSVAPQPYVVQKSYRKLPGPWTTTWSKQYISALHLVTCSLLWVRCLFDRFSISDFGGKWPLKWKFSKMSFRIHRRNTELHFMTKFGENRPLKSRWKDAWIITKNSRSAGLVPAPILPKMDRSRPKLSERCHPLTCLRIPSLVQIGCVLPDIFGKDWFFGPKMQYNIGFQPTINDWKCLVRLNTTE